ncbi:MAG: hypothetical protein MUF57_01170 [Gammaproteobacteria bacterium]|jgi:hypothetical protein|nr:hypothetical protein [Gammaproteobacteria bacterium]
MHAEPTNSQVGLRIAVAGTLEYRDKDGNVIGTAEMTGTLPLNPTESPTPDALGGKDHGLDHD